MLPQQLVRVSACFFLSERKGEEQENAFLCSVKLRF